MARLTPEERFRQLALDLDAVDEDNPELTYFQFDFGAHHLACLTLRREGKQRLRYFELAVHATQDRTRAALKLHVRSRLSRLGLRLGLESRSVPAAPGFDERFVPIMNDAPALSVTAAAALCASAKARQSCLRLQEMGYRWISVEGSAVRVGMWWPRAADFDVMRARDTLECLAELESSFGAYALVPPDRSPEIGPDGRRRIRREASPAPASNPLIAAPFAALGVLILAWIGHRVALPGYAIDAARESIAVLGVLSMLAALWFAVHRLRGHADALPKIVVRGSGLAVVIWCTTALGAHGLNRWADRGTGSVEQAYIEHVRPSAYRNPGSTRLKLPGRSAPFTIPRAYGRAGQTRELHVRHGFFGWAWLELP